jgi:mitochondrial fission protein ELM1
MMKKKMGKTSLNSSCTGNLTSLAGAKNNSNSTAASPMQDAKKHVKDAQNAVALMMAGNSSVTTDQVNGNVSLALDAMNNLTMSMG